MDYLTRAEQQMVAALPSGSFSIDDVRKGGNRRYRLALLDRLVRKGHLVRMKPGRYYFGSNSSDDRMGMALALNPGAYVGMVSALKHWGLVDEELSCVFVCTRSSRGLIDFGAFDVQRIPLGDDFYGIVQTGGLRFSTRAKTFFDCLKKPVWAGGIRRVLSALTRAALSSVEWRELLHYLEQTRSKSFKQRAGFWLQSQSPEWFLKSLEAAIGRKSVVRLERKAGAVFDDRWGVYHGSLA